MSRSKITGKDISLVDVIKTFFKYRKSIALSLILGILVSGAVYYKTSYNRFFISDMVRLNYFEINKSLNTDPIVMSAAHGSTSVSKKFLVTNFLKILSDKKLINKNLNKHYYGKEDSNSQSIQSTASDVGENNLMNVNVDTGKIVAQNVNLTITKVTNSLYEEIEININFEYEGENHDGAKKFVFNLLDSAEAELQRILLEAKKQELRRVKYLVDKLFQSHFKQKLNRAKIEGTFSEDDLSEIELQVLRTEVLRQDSQLYALNKSALDLGLVIDLYTKKRVDILSDFPREFYVSKTQKTFAIIAIGLFVTFFYLILIFLRTFYRFL